MIFKCFVRFILAQAAVMHGIELMTALFRTVRGMISTIVDSSGLTALCAAALPDEMVTIMESVGLIDSIPLWAIAPHYRAALSRWPGFMRKQGRTAARERKGRQDSPPKPRPRHGRLLALHSHRHKKKEGMEAGKRTEQATGVEKGRLE